MLPKGAGEVLVSEPKPVRQPRRWRLILACGLLSILAVLGHYLYWYAPRARRAQPVSNSLVDRLWADERFSQALWLPYPHQNLPTLARATGIDGAALRRVGGALGFSNIELPGFGPLALPPANALTLAVWQPQEYAHQNGRQEQVVLAAQVYPGFALFARLAGRLAGNPWLAGGQVVADGRSMQVAWHGRTWVVASMALAELMSEDGESRQKQPGLAPSLAAFRWPTMFRSPTSAALLPDGPLLIDWQEEPAALLVRSPSSSLEAMALPPRPDLEAAGAVLLALIGRREGEGGDEKEAAKGMALFTVTPPLATELPWTATFFESENDRWKIPAEDILELSGREMRTAEFGGLQIGAFQDDSLGGGQRLAPAAAEWLASPRLKLAVWLQLEAGRQEMARISAGLESSPLIARSQRQQWHGAELLLSALAEQFEGAELLVMEQPPAARLQLIKDVAFSARNDRVHDYADDAADQTVGE